MVYVLSLELLRSSEKQPPDTIMCPTENFDQIEPDGGRGRRLRPVGSSASAPTGAPRGCVGRPLPLPPRVVGSDLYISCGFEGLAFSGDTFFSNELF